MSSAIVQNLKKLVLNCPAWFLRKVVVQRRLASNPSEIDDCIETFCGNKRYSATERTELKRRVRKDMRDHLITPDEYFLYDFASKTEQQKRSFVGDMERTVLCARLYNNNPAGLIFMDKMKTYEHFEPYFKRDVIKVASEADRETFERFISKHDRYMVKPIASSRGKGIRKIDASHTSESSQEIFDGILKSGACVIEELIDQDKRMSDLHPQSVNTIRYATYYDRGRIWTLACFIKIGRGESVVDNGGAGGFLAAIDEGTGIIITPGRTEFGEVIHVHPDTGVPIVGFKIPAWNELKSLVETLVKVLPEQKYVGWDLALSESEGWVLVEGNSGGQFVGPQIAKGQGVRDLVEATFGSL